MCNCNNPIYRTNENFCRNCGEEKTRQQFTKKSEGEFYGEVDVRARGYVIIITSKNDENSYYEFTQKKVKELEKVTGVTGQELADLIANKTSKISYSFNGKYGQGSISYDLRSEDEKQKAEEEKIKRQEEAKKEEELKQQKNLENWKKYAGKEFTAKNENGRIKIDKLEEYNVYNSVGNMFRVALNGLKDWNTAKLILPDSEDKIKNGIYLNVEFIKTLVIYE